jgi:hypothetical protein
MTDPAEIHVDIDMASAVSLDLISGQKAVGIEPSSYV